MNKKTMLIPALDNYPLEATIIKPEGVIKGVIQFQSGTAVRKEFYTRFCMYLAKQGYIVVMFD